MAPNTSLSITAPTSSWLLPDVWPPCRWCLMSAAPPTHTLLRCFMRFSCACRDLSFASTFSPALLVKRTDHTNRKKKEGCSQVKKAFVVYFGFITLIRKLLLAEVMGCCNSKEIKKPEQVVAHAPSIEDEIPVEESIKSILKESDDRPLGCVKYMERLNRANAARSTGFRYNKCTVDGEITSFFPPKGLCFRIISGDTWFFYNDTLNYEMHVSYRFSPDAAVNPAARTTVETAENGWTTISLILYPLETVEFLSGATDVYMTDVSAYPLSDEYLRRLTVVTCASAEEMKRVHELNYETANEEKTLKACMSKNIPFVDLMFPPSVEMLSRPGVDGRRMPVTEIRRLSENLSGNAGSMTTIRDVAIPQCIDGGILGDNWIACAMAILAENGERVSDLFAQSAAEEQQAGAYRVLLNKDGWWTSVLLDDFLPMINRVPCFARVLDDPSEMWVSLLQKAYAKVHGSYASITGGDTTLALHDFTGAPTYRLDEEWVKAIRYNADINKFLDKLAHYIDAGNIVILNTPQGKNIEKCAQMGLKDGYAYLLEAVHQFPDDRVTLLRLRNPWKPTAPWSGTWCSGSTWWENHPDVCSGCNPDFEMNDGSFYVDLAEAAEYFDGCGVVFVTGQPVYDYRVRGKFNYVHPNVVLKVNAAERVEVVLTLSQKDKRGVDIRTPDAKLSPIMLSVSRSDGNKQIIHQCSTSDPECPSADYKFIVAREVAMTYTFEPRNTPYFVIPRIHLGRFEERRAKDYVLGVRSATPLEGKLDVQFTTLETTSRVFQNRVSFIAEYTEEVDREWQLKAPEEAVVTHTGSQMSSADIEAPQGRTEDESEEQEEKTFEFNDKIGMRKGGGSEVANGVVIDNAASLSGTLNVDLNGDTASEVVSQEVRSVH